VCRHRTLAAWARRVASALQRVPVERYAAAGTVHGDAERGPRRCDEMETWRRNRCPIDAGSGAGHGVCPRRRWSGPRRNAIGRRSQLRARGDHQEFTLSGRHPLKLRGRYEALPHQHIRGCRGHLRTHVVDSASVARCVGDERPQRAPDPLDQAVRDPHQSHRLGAILEARRHAGKEMGRRSTDRCPQRRSGRRFNERLPSAGRPRHPTSNAGPAPVSETRGGSVICIPNAPREVIAGECRRGRSFDG